MAGDAGGVPGPEALTDTDAVLCILAKGETIADIAARYGVSTASLLARNGLSWRTPVTPGDVIRIRTTEPQEPPAVAEPLRRHRVGPNDSASAIAAAHGVATAALLLANGLSRTSRLEVGRELVIPKPAPLAETNRTELQLSGSMRVHAERIIALGDELGIGDHGVLAALVAAMQDSALHNLDATRADAPAGLFLQRPADDWGSATEVRDADHAIRAFYGGPARPVGCSARGVLDVGGWRLMSVGELAAAVQGRGQAAAYEKWVPCAEGWLRRAARAR